MVPVGVVFAVGLRVEVDVGRLREGVVDAGLFAVGLLVGRDVLPPIIPPPVTPPSCCAQAAVEQVSKSRSANTNGNRQGRGAVIGILR